MISGAEEETREDDLEGYLNPHVEDEGHHVILPLSLKLLLGQLELVVLLINKLIMQGEQSMHDDHSRYPDDVNGKHRSVIIEESRHQHQDEVDEVIPRLGKKRGRLLCIRELDQNIHRTAK